MGRDAQPRYQASRCHERRGADGEGGVGPDERDQAAGEGGREDLDQPAGGPRHRVRRQPLLLARERRDNGLHRRVEEGVARGEAAATA